MSKKTVQALSFITGLTLSAVIIGVVLSKNDQLRNEVESQLQSILKTTRTLTDTLKSVTSKASAAASLVRNDEEKAAALNEATLQQKDQLAHQWDIAEAQLG